MPSIPVDKKLDFLAEVGGLYNAKYLNPLWSCHQYHEQDPWDSLALFLEGYAFERQGRRPDFSHAAAAVIAELKSNGVKLDETTSPHMVWQSFCEKLGGRGLNHALSPMCPKDTTYASARRRGNTYQPSAVELAAELWQGGHGITITSFARFSLQENMVQQAWNTVSRVNGVGPKIVAFFLRDVALYYGIAVTSHRDWLQPIDVHVRRISQEIMKAPSAGDAAIALWITSRSQEAGVPPELVNAGMWYLGSQVCGSEYRTFRALEDLSHGKALVDEHVGILRQVALAWRNC